jgi:predicted SAM-dependent methyltransferase
MGEHQKPIYWYFQGVVIMPYVPLVKGQPATYVPPINPKAKNIEIGGGKNPLLRPNVDIIPGPTVDVVHDLSTFPWPLETGAYDGVISLYAIEHIEWRKTLDFINELYRILKPDGRAVVITANLLEQCKSLVAEGVNEKTVERIFGSQEFPNYGGCHKTGFSPDYAVELFTKAGFEYVKIYPHPISTTDMIIEAFKMKEIFERQYFEDGTIGYREYRDFATHYDTVERILAVEPKVKSLLDIGGGRGYICRILEGKGIPSTCMDVSKYCQKTRATDNFILWDATKTPWPDTKSFAPGLKIPDKSFDLCFSMNFLEHLREEQIPAVLLEMARVSNRGMHGIHMTDPPFQEMDKDMDVTHHTMHDKAWWMAKFNEIVPGYPVYIDHPRNLEYSRPELQPPVSLAPPNPDNLVKLNLGSYKDMFYYGWLNCDILDLAEFAQSQAYCFMQMDVTKTPWPLRDGEVDLIFSSHLIEHLTRDEGRLFLNECHRVMKPGGVIRISVPDLQLIAKDYVEGHINEYRYVNVGVERASDDAEAFYELLLRNHKTVYDDDSLTKLLQEAGFKEVHRVSAFDSRSPAMKTQTTNTFPDLSLIVEAVR